MLSKLFTIGLGKDVLRLNVIFRRFADSSTLLSEKRSSDVSDGNLSLTSWGEHAVAN